MKHSKKILWFLSILIVLSLLLSACGADEPEVPAPAEQAPAAEVAPAESAPAEPAAEEAAPTEESAPAEEAAPTQAEAAAPAASNPGDLVADLGFRPESNGFAFPNYGADQPVKNLTEDEMQRMFGDQVCALKQDGKCVLSPTAQQWMEQINSAMSGGHCEGMATLSLLLFDGKIKPADFGADAASGLKLDDEKLQREIAYWWSTQVVTPTAASVIKGTPVDILNVLKEMKPGGETYTIGIYKRDRSGGHAITPYAVKDEGDGIFSILAYDNNYPGAERKVTVDSNKNTWSYEASINPDVQSELYEGDAETQTLDLTPSSARLTTQDCAFCSGSVASKGGGLAAQAPRFNQIYLEGEGHLLIQDEQGHQLGYVDGKIVNQIPNAQYVSMKVGNSATDSPEPVYMVPEGMDVKVTIDGSTLKEESMTDLVMIGPGFSIGVEGIGLEPNQKDTVEFYPKDEMIIYDTDSSESPNFVVTVENQGGNDYDFEVMGADMQGGGTITLWLDTKKGDMLINTEKLQNEGKFEFNMTRYSDTEEEGFTASDIALKAGAIVYVDYSEWKGNGTSVQFGVDTNGDGEIDDEYVADDSN